MNKIIIAFAVAAAVAGCAKRPDAIVQVEKAKLDDLSKQQISAANGDAFGVFLVGVPIGSVAGGDKEGEIAASKGKVSAMQSAGMSKGCKLPG
ncbi:hypothetical protein E0I74_29900 [Rhizobium laguerreae]|jgi:hypothetical protein|uniref:hypothetical protein n=1 Tax=Rhizobium laguerreae TaxID=1076926 RepID=UPI00103B3677|nr:hypothetical protein [Rhizobium laguerreae]MBY3099844.1 hypothetical protein [Rhizobium laguerreae]MBY3104410.1 hypothetical protein [Rhizobium laguerreae]MBY3124229.1 hypothetical protein [Rhizobium laguerreae]MBY3163563.1 hypothetical protein [Rhizobium laguerreae]MBY3200424.1 hypothetical protein [Rhizobium laguerreae]